MKKSNGEGNKKMFMIFTAINMLYLSLVEYNTRLKWYEFRKKFKLRQQMQAAVEVINNDDIFLIAKAMMHFASTMESAYKYRFPAISAFNNMIAFQDNVDYSIIYRSYYNCFEVTDIRRNLVYTIYGKNDHVPYTLRDRWKEAQKFIRSSCRVAVRYYASEHLKERKRSIKDERGRRYKKPKSFY